MLLSRASAIGRFVIKNRAPPSFLSDQSLVRRRFVRAQEQIGVVVGSHAEIILTRDRRNKVAAEAVCKREVGVGGVHNIDARFKDGNCAALILADYIVN